MFNREIYIKRRKKLMEQVGKGLILLLGNEESPMNYPDNCYPFRQDSSFLYFFGLNRPGLSAIIDIDNNHEIIFGDDIGIEDIIWTGPIESLSDQAQQVGVGNTKPKKEVEKYLSSAISS